MRLYITSSFKKTCVLGIFLQLRLQMSLGAISKSALALFYNAALQLAKMSSYIKVEVD